MTADRSSADYLVRLKGATVEIAGITDRGTVREQNQDVWCQVSGPAGAESCTLVLADGMGGHRGGLESAEAAVREAVATIGTTAARPAEIIAAAGRGVAGVREAIGGSPGTTLVMAAIDGAKACVAHVGDSRAYLVRDGEARPLTSDHTWAAEEVAAGRLGAAEARHHPRRNLITRAVLGDPVDPDVAAVQLRPDDVLMLCSDGLWEPLEDGAIGRLLGGKAPLSALVEAACDAALAAGSKDNVTLVAARLLAR